MVSILSEDGRIEEVIKERTTEGGILFNIFKNTFLGKKEIPKDIRVQVFKKVVAPILLYGEEAWTMRDKKEK